MRYNRDEHNRRSLRWQGYDYSQQGGYFVTVCIQHRESILGDIVAGEMRLSVFGEIVRREWLALQNRFPTVMLDDFVIMPNHFHGILRIDGVTTSNDAVAMPDGAPLAAPRSAAPTLSAIIRAFKSLSARQINRARNTSVHVWQRSFHDRVIRDEPELIRIRQYIIENPLNWHSDPENPNHY